MGFKFEKQELMSQDFLPAFVLLAQSETHLDEGWGGGEGGMLQGFRAGAEAGDPVSLGVSSSWPWWSGEEKVRVVYLTTAMQLVKLGPGHTSRRPSLLPAPLSVPHSLGQGQVSPVGLEGEAGK